MVPIVSSLQLLETTNIAIEMQLPGSPPFVSTLEFMNTKKPGAERCVTYSATRLSQ
jgi:hypothetical protein